jgi:NTE family protein
MNKLGLCLSGGGARGAYQIGVAKRLEELGVLAQVQAFAGTSIGAVNAAMLATQPVDKTYQLWKAISPDEIKSTENIFKRLMQEKIHILDKGLYSIEALRNLLWEEIDYQEILKKEVYVTLSEAGMVDESLFGLFKSGYRHYVKNDTQAVYSLLKNHTKEDIVNLILASCSIPIIFPSVKIKNKQYYDGGVYDNTPVYPLIESGCDTIIVIHLQLLDFIDKSKYPGINIIEIKHRGILGGMLNFDPAHSEICYNLGYQDACNFFEKNSLK